MFGKSSVSDKSLSTMVSQRLARAGVGALNISVRNGAVTLAGMIKYEAQRRSAISTASAIEGVRSVTDQLKVRPVEKNRN